MSHFLKIKLIAHEIEVAAAVGMLGSIDANSGDTLLGWDTDQFNTDVKELTLAMVSILRAGGLGSGGFNFDAKLRRPSIWRTSFTRTSAAWIPMRSPTRSPARSSPTAGSTSSWPSPTRATTPVTARKSKAEPSGLRNWRPGEPKPVSGRQEYLENLLNTYLHA
jgi:xylose isomerase